MALAYDARRATRDILILVKHLQLTTASEVLAICAEVFPDEQIPDRARVLLEDVLAAGG